MKTTWRLSHARGYLALGLYDEAEGELDAVKSPDSELPEVLALRATILQHRGQWLLLRPVAAELVRIQPEEAGWWITWAYATRRAESLHAAEAILREAEIIHPDEPTVQFNLGCYACQRGDLAEAGRRVRRAVVLDPSFLELARTDADLTALRASGFDAGSD